MSKLLKQHQEKIAMSCGGGELGYTSEPHESRIKVEWFYERQFTTATNIFLPLPYKKRGCGLRQISACSLFLEISTKNEYVKIDNPNGGLCPRHERGSPLPSKC